MTWIQNHVQEELAAGWLRLGLEQNTAELLVRVSIADIKSLKTAKYCVKNLKSIPKHHILSSDTSGYLFDGHPTVAEGIVSRTVYFECSSNAKYDPTPIEVLNCGDFYVYHLPNTPNCYEGFCGID